MQTRKITEVQETGLHLSVSRRAAILHRLNRQDIALSASVSCFDLYHIQSDMEQVNSSAVSFLHFDVVDGRFNECFILGTPTLAAIRPHTRLPIEAHLAVYEPIRFVDQYAACGADYIAVHAEADSKDGILECFEAIRRAGAEPVLALRAETEVEDDILTLARHVTWILKLTVDPGYAGQAIKPAAFESIRRLRSALTEEGLDIGIQADGNVNVQTIPQLVRAGADMLTGGTSGLFVRDSSVADNARCLLEAARQAALND